MAHMHVSLLEALIQQLEQVCSTTSKWHARQVAIEFLQNLIFCNLFNARPYANRLHALVLKCLFDEQLEVRLIASATLSSFYQCGYLQVTDDDLVRRIYLASFLNHSSVDFIFAETLSRHERNELFYDHGQEKSHIDERSSQATRR